LDFAEGENELSSPTAIGQSTLAGTILRSSEVNVTQQVKKHHLALSQIAAGRDAAQSVIGGAKVMESDQFGEDGHSALMAVLSVTGFSECVVQFGWLSQVSKPDRNGTM
jgi:hypothetical protein